jgi:hypothetical protein
MHDQVIAQPHFGEMVVFILVQLMCMMYMLCIAVGMIICGVGTLVSNLHVFMQEAI